jgi:hypothetical protein
MSTQEFKGAFSTNSIILPPKTSTIDIPKRYYRFVVDSRDRHMGYFKNPNTYDLKISQDIHDVQSIELLSFDIPFTKYLISTTNNTLFYKLSTNSSIIYEVKIPIGDYESGNSLVSALNIATLNIMHFTFNSLNHKISVNKSDSLDENVSLTILVEGIADKTKNNYERPSPVYKSQLLKTLGSKNENILLSDSIAFELSYRVDFRKDKYIVMSLNPAYVNYSENNNTHKSFAIIKKNDIDNKSIDTNYKKTFNPPIPSLTTLKISFKDYDGNLYDFQNQDHMIELLICCFKQTRKYNDIFS